MDIANEIQMMDLLYLNVKLLDSIGNCGKFLISDTWSPKGSPMLRDIQSRQITWPTPSHPISKSYANVASLRTYHNQRVDTRMYFLLEACVTYFMA